ncbi:hypothetical protein ABZ791_28070 [Streptomyces huasconensis]|uniref:Uncharacterized protein n=1 Tax=Streptomyces huasconensis TaxID=1854574 RepID=A0ABV3LX87_9ACTN
MSDLYELQLALDFPDSLSAADLDVLRWHLGEGQDAVPDGAEDAEEYPLLSSRGPAQHIGGALVCDLCRSARGWALSARQEVHPDEFDDLHRLLAWLAARATTVGAVGHLRFYEAEVPDVLIAEAGSFRRVVLRPSGPAEGQLLPGALD